MGKSSNWAYQKYQLLNLDYYTDYYAEHPTFVTVMS